jgi:hypothetical protein
MLAEFAAVGTPAEVARTIRERYAGLLTRVSFNAPYEIDPGVWPELLAAMRA